MNMAFYSCNGFSLGTNPAEFCGPDPMWRDLLNGNVRMKCMREAISNKI